MTDVTYAAGWYPDTNEIGNERYYDGMAWTAQTRPVTAATTTTTPVRDTGAKRPWYKRKALIIPVAIVGGIIVLSSVISAVTGGDDDTAALKQPAGVSQTDDEAAEPAAPVDDRQEMPSLLGMTVGEARSAVEGAGFVLVTDQPDQAVISEQDLSAGEKTDAGASVTVVASVPLTLAQENVIAQAESYLDYSGFSRAGLIGQLEFEGYSTADATFGADSAGADWNAEAAEKAESYLETSSFSREGLYDQLAFEEFTPEQIEFALKAVGY